MRTRLDHPPCVESQLPHRPQPHRQFARDRYRNRAVLLHRQLHILSAPIGVEPHRCVRRFSQQPGQRRIALLGEVFQPLPPPPSYARRESAPDSWPPAGCSRSASDPEWSAHTAAPSPDPPRTGCANVTLRSALPPPAPPPSPTRQCAGSDAPAAPAGLRALSPFQITTRSGRPFYPPSVGR